MSAPTAPASRFFSTLKPLLSLATPLVVTEAGLVVMNLVDTLVVGRVGPEAIGAVGLGNILFVTVAIFGMGLLLGLDTVVSRSYGAARFDECWRWLVHGVVLAAAAAGPLMLVVVGLIRLLPTLAIEPTVLGLLIPYMEVSAWGLPALLLFAAFRRYLQAMSIVRPIAAAVLVANLVNLLLAIGFVHGWGDFPGLGAVGSAWATLISRIGLAAALVAIVARRIMSSRPRFHKAPRIDSDRLWRLLALGVPAATQVTLEVGVFATATALASMLDVASLSAHQIVIQISTLTFIVAVGVGAAGGVLVGQSLGEGDGRKARGMGWMALQVGVCFMALAAGIFVLLRREIVAAFSPDTAVVELGSQLLLVAAAFQLFDGLQAVATGVLRGLGDTRTPMLANLAGHWLLGLPLGYTLCFVLGLGVLGLWLGLSLGLAVVGLFLLRTWIRRARYLQGGFVAAPLAGAPAVARN